MNIPSENEAEVERWIDENFGTVESILIEESDDETLRPNPKN